MRLVMKFGGSLLTSGNGIRRSAGLALDEVGKGNRTVVVVSAMKGVTDRLAGSLDSVPGVRGNREDLCRQLAELHLSAAREAIGPPVPGEICQTVSALASELLGSLSRYDQGDRSPHVIDEILAMGERLCAPVFSATLESMGCRSRPLTGGEAGIITDSNYGDAFPVMSACDEQIPLRLGGLLGGGITPVVTGFVAQDGEGLTTTLGRGGSDYTASIIGSCLPSDEIWIWKDVGGIMTADPAVVAEARTIPALSYSEAAELAHFGAEVLHPRTMDPAAEKSIPIRVKSAADPSGGGSLITSRSAGVPGSAKAVTKIDLVGLVAISGTRMVGVPGVAARVFDSLARVRANVVMISQSSSETNITIVVHRRDMPACRESLGKEFGGDETVTAIDFQEDLSVVSVVGSGMKGTPGVAARVFGAVADAGINVVMIAQGSSEANISFAVDRANGCGAVRAIHERFRLDSLFPE